MGALAEYGGGSQVEHDAVDDDRDAGCWTNRPGDCHDVNFFDELPVGAGDYFVFDRGYLDLARLYRIAQAGA